MKFVRSLAAVALVCGIASLVHAQGTQTGTIRGVVHDDQGLPVPGVTVTVSSPALQSPRAGVSDTSGGFSFPNLPPGDYTVRFELSGFAIVNRPTKLPLGLVVEQNVTMKPAGVAETVQVVAESPVPIATPIVGTNIKHEEIEALATPRTLQGIATLAPAVSENSPNGGQLVINGAFAFDNIFMVNGVDVNDNLFANPQNLFIEDAIEETQVLTSGISAEYGRFSGGVVNAITKSGGNTFSGSGRVNFLNAAWTDETPFEKARNIERPSKLQETYEGTFGGPILKDHLWFFSAGRYAVVDTPQTIQQTAVQVIQNDNNKRGELKLTGTIAQNHTIQGAYLNNARTTSNTSGIFSLIADPRALVTRTLPNSYYYTNYRGVFGSGTLLEAQYSQRHFEFQNDGLPGSTNILDSAFYAPSLNVLYSSPYFCACDPEQRNNRQADRRGYELLDCGRPPPDQDRIRVVPQSADRRQLAVGDAVRLQQRLPARRVGRAGARRAGPADSGVRPRRVVDRLLSGRDRRDAEHRQQLALPAGSLGDQRQAVGRHRRALRAREGRVDGRHRERADQPHRAAARPRLRRRRQRDAHRARHLRPVLRALPGEPDRRQQPRRQSRGHFQPLPGARGPGLTFAPGLNVANYPVNPDNASLTVPTANVFVDPNTKSALTHEVTVSYGANINRGKGYAEVAYVHRKVGSLIEDFITRADGTTNVVAFGIDAGLLSNRVYRNTDLASRVYDGMVFQSRYQLSNRWTINGQYTLELRNEGNYEGEGTNTPGSTSRIGDYPEAFPEARFYPTGCLNNFERSRIRAWSIYNFRMGGMGDLSVSGLWRYDSPQVYSIRVLNVPPAAAQRAILRAAGYPDLPQNSNVYYDGRNTQEFAGYGMVDANISYNIPVAGSVRPWIKFDIYNLLNNDKLITWNTTYRQDPSTPFDALGFRTGVIQGPQFGQATGQSNFPAPFGGATGGRTFRLAVGVRF